jgi:hypothetical protein
VAVCAVVVVALTVSGCRSEPVEDTSGLRDLDDIPIAPEPEDSDPAADPGPEAGADQDPNEADPIDGEAEDGPGEDAWPDDLVISRDAVSINEDLDVDQGAQLALLRRYAEGYSLIVALFAGDEVDPRELEEHFSPRQLEGIRGSAERLEADNEVQLGPDSVTLEVRIDSFDGSGAIIHRCQRHGPESGVYDRDTGDLIMSPPTEWQLFAASMALLLDEGAPARWVQDDGAVISDAPCA